MESPSFLMMLFQSELGSSVLELLDRSTVFGRRAPLQKKERKGIGGVRPSPIRCLSQFFLVEKKIKFLGNEV